MPPSGVHRLHSATAPQSEPHPGSSRTVPAQTPHTPHPGECRPIATEAHPQRSCTAHRSTAHRPARRARRGVERSSPEGAKADGTTGLARHTPSAAARAHRTDTACGKMDAGLCARVLARNGDAQRTGKDIESRTKPRSARTGRAVTSATSRKSISPSTGGETSEEHVDILDQGIGQGTRRDDPDLLTLSPK